VISLKIHKTTYIYSDAMKIKLKRDSQPKCSFQPALNLSFDKNVDTKFGLLRIRARKCTFPDVLTETKLFICSQTPKVTIKRWKILMNSFALKVLFIVHWSKWSIYFAKMQGYNNNETQLY